MEINRKRSKRQKFVGIAFAEVLSVGKVSVVSITSSQNFVVSKTS